ncbi:hypothetical protein K7X08_004336 [Anisodus acutangulus]|uniref:Uncharacterized protein n=1 Tax=Anisodus acutangulus TaxID=402998 RepID=A0A9Q1RHC3_9SOLA|nr:hypothetical protein K7X08_004336 [Anisodus acutangulus]
MALGDAHARLRDSRNLDTLAGPLWFLQLWITLYFPEFIPDKFDDRRILLNPPVLADTLRRTPFVPQNTFAAVSTLHATPSPPVIVDLETIFDTESPSPRKPVPKQPCQSGGVVIRDYSQKGPHRLRVPIPAEEEEQIKEYYSTG